jgi:hypothetical protein
MISSSALASSSSRARGERPLCLEPPDFAGAHSGFAARALAAALVGSLVVMLAPSAQAEVFHSQDEALAAAFLG